MRKDVRTAWLLLLLCRQPSYGYELRRELAIHATPVDGAVVYRSLQDMERDGLILSRWVRSDAGPSRRVYEITASGRDTLVQIAATVRLTRDTHSTFLEAYARRTDHHAGGEMFGNA